MPGSPTPPLIQEAFGTGAASGYITNPIPVASQIGVKAGAASYTDGFPPLTMTATASGGVNPFGQDMNGVLFAATANIAALTGGQQYQFNAAYATASGGYALGAIVAMANGAGYWINQTAGNSNNPDTTAAASSGWAPLAAYGSAAISGLAATNVTLTAAQAAMSLIVFSGALTANVQIIFPTWLKRWVVINNTTGAFSLTCKTAAGTGVVIGQFGAIAPVQLVGDGANIQQAAAAAGISGSFTAASADIVGNPTGTVYYAKIGALVTLYTDSDLSLMSGTSNNTTCILTGLPSFLTPAKFTGGYLCIYGAEDNGAPVWAAATIGPSAQLAFVKLSTFGAAPSVWTATGTKAVPAFNFTYPLA